MTSDRPADAVERPDRPTADMRQDWRCSDCELTVTVWSSDPYYPDEVNCPECGQFTERGGQQNE